SARDELKGEKRGPFLALGSSQLCELPDAEAIRRLMSKNLRKDALRAIIREAGLTVDEFLRLAQTSTGTEHDTLR
ncbi:MAG: hypothetical protein COZ56_17260, partial [Armatimonadetes bacterium CG_4_8_14_3_um_filter_58_9]